MEAQFWGILKMISNKESIKKSPKAAIYLIPNFFTTMNIFCGFYAVIAVINENFVAASIAVLVAVIFDILDGKIARATKTTSRFGVEYDSLSDLISFGVAPAIMIYLWVLQSLGKIAWVAAFLFIVCGALRLARFNTQAGTNKTSDSNKYFVGLPIPAAAAMTAATVLFFNKLGLSAGDHKITILLMLYTLSFLMISTIRYNSFKSSRHDWKIRFDVMVGAMLSLIFFVALPSIALFFMGLIYIISGPFAMLLGINKKKSGDTQHDESIQPEEEASPVNL